MLKVRHLKRVPNTYLYELIAEKTAFFKNLNKILFRASFILYVYEQNIDQYRHLIMRKYTNCYSIIEKLPGKFIHAFCLAISLFFVSFPLFGQNRSDSLNVKLPPIEVTAIRSSISAANAPLSLSIENRNLMTVNSSSSLSLKSIGNELPGLWVNDRQNYALGERLTIRGLGWRAAFGVRGIQVVLNDIPLTIADGQSITNIIDPAFIRRAELIRGPAATYWGNSSGGVLYLSTEPNYGEGTHARFRTMGGSYGMSKGEAELSISSKNHNLNAYSSYLSTNGYRNYSEAKLWRSGINGSVKLTSKSRLEYQALSIYMPEAQHPSSLTADQADQNPAMAIDSYRQAGAGKEITQGQAGLSYLLDTPAGLLTVSGYGVYRDLNNPLPFGIITVNRWAGGLRGTLEESFGSLDVQVGTEAKLQNDDRQEFENSGNAQRGATTVDQTERVWNQALFANGTYHLGSFNILAGLRYDRLRFATDTLSTEQTGARTFDALSPSVGISYKLPRQTLFFNASTSFQAPTTTELVNRPDGGNGFNPNLKPERTVGLEAGIRNHSSQTFEYDFTVYHLWIYDLLFPYQLRADGPTFYRNQGETVHYGLEGLLSYQLNRDINLSVTANLTKATFQKAQTLDSLSLEGNDVPGIPDLRVYSEINWSPDRFFFSLSYEYTSSYDVNNINSQTNDAYGVFDSKLSYQYIFKQNGVKLQPFINVQNLLNTRYNGSVAINNPGNRYYEPAPGRHWQAGLSVQF